MSATHFSGPVVSTNGFTGAVTGNITGNITGNVTGNVTGDLTGNVTGNVTGNITGAISASSITLDTGTRTASATAGAATLNKNAGVITSESLTTAAGADYTLTLTNSVIAATDIVLPSVQTGTNTTAGLAVHEVTPGSGSCTIVVRNNHASSALNGTIKISFVVVKQ